MGSLVTWPVGPSTTRKIDGNMAPGVGPRARMDSQTHREFESLPSGFWGYYHFPRMARAQSAWGKPWLAMNGRFQKMWEDFSGIKPRAALEFECFWAQALGGANSVGDRLPPRGRLNPAAFELIGAVCKQWETAEPFYADSTFLSLRSGIFSASFAGQDGGISEDCAVLLAEEAHYDVAMLDWADDFRGYQWLILPETPHPSRGCWRANFGTITAVVGSACCPIVRG